MRGRTLGNKGRFVATRRSAQDTVWQRKLESWLEELLDVVSANILSLNFSNPNDLDRSEASTVTGSHILVAEGDSTSTSDIAVLLVHVVGARASIVAEPDAVVFYGGWLLVEDLADADDLPVGLLDTAQLLEEVPKAALGDDRVGRKQAHSVELRCRVAVRWQHAANDLVLVQLNDVRGIMATPSASPTEHVCDDSVSRTIDGWMDGWMKRWQDLLEAPTFSISNYAFQVFKKS